MNTTNNKTSLYDSVTKSDGMNMVSESNKKTLYTTYREEESNSNSTYPEKRNRMNIIGKINKERLDDIPRGSFLTILDKFGEVVATFIHAGRVNGSGFLNPIIVYYHGIGWLKECPSFKLDEIDMIRFATQTEIDILIQNMSKEGYLWDGWNVIRNESTEENDEETIDESPAEEEIILSRPNKKKCIIDKAIENKIAHNINVSKDILDNTLPYYVINDKMEYLVRTTDKSLKRDLNNFNYFTNKEDINEAIRRVKETLMNFQEEIQNRNK